MPVVYQVMRLRNRLRIIPFTSGFEPAGETITLAEFEAFLAWMKSSSDQQWEVGHARIPSQPFQRACQRREWFAPVY